MQSVHAQSKSSNRRKGLGLCTEAKKSWEKEDIKLGCGFFFALKNMKMVVISI